MKLLLTFLALFLFAAASLQAQTKLPRTFIFKKENSSKGLMGSGALLGRFYALEPAGYETYDKGTKAHQALGASTFPKSNIAALLFINAQNERQLSAQKDKTAVITYDSVQIKDLQYEDIGQTETDDSAIKTEGAAVSISFEDFSRIMKANRVTIKFGAVTYQLTRDNLAAFRYMSEQIEKDSKPVSNRKGIVKTKTKKAR